MALLWHSRDTLLWQSPTAGPGHSQARRTWGTPERAGQGPRAFVGTLDVARAGTDVRDKGRGKGVLELS